MDPALWIVLAVAAAAGVPWLFELTGIERTKVARLLKGFEREASLGGLEVQTWEKGQHRPGRRDPPPGVPARIELTGTRRGIEVEVAIPFTTTRNYYGSWVRAWPDGLHPSIRLMDEVERRKLSMREFREDLVVGDPLFDELVVVQGQRAEVMASLTEAARTQLVRIIGHDGFRIENSELRIRLTDRSSRWVQKDLNSLLRVAEAFHSKLETPERLLNNMRTDPVAAVRQGNAVMLLEHFPDSEAAGQAADELFAPLRAGRSHSGLGDPEEPYGSTVLELRSLVLAACRDPEQNLSILQGLIGLGTRLDLEIEGALQEELGTASYPHLNITEEDALRVVAALSAGSTRAARLLLLQLAGPNFPPAVRRAAVNALGSCGTVDEVEHLLQLPNPLLAAGFKGEVQAAVQRIQARLGNAGAGRLAVLADGDGDGGLTLIEGEGGLSVSEDES